jgi:putative transposase
VWADGGGLTTQGRSRREQVRLQAAEMFDDEQVAQLRAALEAGPSAYGWAQDQRWTLARVAALVMRLFGVSYTLRGVSFLLHRLGFSPQVPVHRAFERDQDAVAEWRSATWAKVRGKRR